MLDQNAGIRPDQYETVGDVFIPQGRDDADQCAQREDDDGPSRFGQAETVPADAHEQYHRVRDHRHRDPAEIDRKRQPEKPFFARGHFLRVDIDDDVDQIKEQKPHQDHRQRDAVIMPCENPRGIGQRGDGKHESDFAHQRFIELFAAAEKSELVERGYGEQKIDQSPDRKRVSRRCEQIGVGIGHLGRVDAVERQDDRQRVSCDHQCEIKCNEKFKQPTGFGLLHKKHSFSVLTGAGHLLC